MVNFPVPLSFRAKHPVVLFSSKYFFRLLSFFTLLGEQEEKKAISNRQQTIFLIRAKISAKVAIIGFA
jgi:hypothetical protein